jgi:hypothetical protein
VVERSKRYFGKKRLELLGLESPLLPRSYYSRYRSKGISLDLLLLTKLKEVVEVKKRLNPLHSTVTKKGKMKVLETDLLPKVVVESSVNQTKKSAFPFFRNGNADRPLSSPCQKRLKIQTAVAILQ